MGIGGTTVPIGITFGSNLPSSAQGPTPGGFFTHPLVLGNIWGEPHTAPNSGDLNSAYAIGAGTPPSSMSNINPFTTTPVPALPFVFLPGAYFFGSSLSLAAGQSILVSGSASDVFVIHVNGDITLGAGATITLVGGAVPSNVFWVTGALTLADPSVFSGIALCSGTANLAANSIVNGAVYAQGPIVTLAMARQSHCLDVRAATCSVSGLVTVTCFPSFALVSGVCVVDVQAPSLGSFACQFSVFSEVAVTILGGGFVLGGDVGNANPIVGAFPTDVSIVAGLSPVPLQTYYNSPSVAPGFIYGPETLTSSAEGEFLAAINFANNQPASGSTSVAAVDLGGLTLSTGVYGYGAALAITGSLTLTGSATDIFIFKCVGALGVSAGSQVVLNGVLATNVFWVSAAAVNIGAGATFSGNVLAEAAVVVGAGATLIGSIFAVGAVSLNGGSVVHDSATCLVAPTVSARARARRYKTLPPRWDRDVIRDPLRRKLLGLRM